MVKIAPSILSADFSRLGEEIARVEAGGADWIHVDVMDGHFVPNLTIGPPVVSCLRKVTRLPLDVHLMVSRPEDLIAPFADAGADILTVHAETAPHLNRLLQMIRERGVRAGVSLNPSTPLSAIEESLADIDLVLIMSVNPGFGGQRFIPSAIDKIRRLKAMISQAGSGALIEVDGGVNSETAPAVIAAGADVLVAGSAVYGQSDVAAAMRMLRIPAGKA